MSELIDKVEEVVGGVFGNNHELKAVAEPALIAAVKAGEEILTHEHLAEIKTRRAQYDIDTLIGACEKFLTLLEKIDGYTAADPIEEPASEPEEHASEESVAGEPEAVTDPETGEPITEGAGDSEDEGEKQPGAEPEPQDAPDGTQPADESAPEA